MIGAVISLIISFLLDTFMSNHLGYTLINTSIFKTIYTLIVLVVIYPHFENEKKYLLLLIISAVLFDVIYSGTFLVNVFIFVLLYLIMKVFNYFLPHNILMINIESLVIIYSYHIISFILLNLVNYNHYDFMLLINIILRSSIMTILATSLIYFAFTKLYNKKIR